MYSSTSSLGILAKKDFRSSSSICPFSLYPITVFFSSSASVVPSFNLRSALRMRQYGKKLFFLGKLNSGFIWRDIEEDDQSVSFSAAMCDSDYDNIEDVTFFREDESFYQPPPKPTTEVVDGVTVHLVAKHALWAHHLWNGGKRLTEMIRRREHGLDVRGKSILEFGSGAALPAIVSAQNGARKVVATDYPEAELIDNIRKNLEENVPDEFGAGAILVEPFLWGRDPAALLRHSPDGFDFLFLADLLANHSALEGLALNVSQTLKRDGGVAYVVFGHHRPWLADRDLAFFAHCAKFGLASEEIFAESFTPMFEDDPGELEVRSTVHCYKVTWPTH